MFEEEEEVLVGMKFGPRFHVVLFPIVLFDDFPISYRFGYIEVKNRA